jgi:hypothetical protein
MIGGSEKVRVLVVYDKIIHVCYTGSYVISWYVKTNIKFVLPNYCYAFA